MLELHLDGWYASLGHYTPRKDLYPHGLAGLKSMVDKIHAAGLKAGLHTLTGCISVNDRWVTPVPDKRLCRDAILTLAAPLTANDTIIQTTEAPPSNLTIDWSYAAGSGNTLQIGDEIIAYTGISRHAPYGFTGCTRGKWGTKPAPHNPGAKVEHLKAIYNAYMPDEASTLVDELANSIATVYNSCGFDALYLDGAEGMGDWHAVAVMKRAIFTRLKRRALVESSDSDAESWSFLSRVGALDHPFFGLKRFVDMHFAQLSSEQNTLLLPEQAGWWSISGPAYDYDAERPDEMEYLAAKCLGWDVPMSLENVTLGARPANARQSELLAMLGRYERLRLAGYFSNAVREKLRVPGDEFHLEQDAQGEWQLVPTDYLDHRVTALTDGSNTWAVPNRYSNQPVKLRIQALYAPDPYDTAQAAPLTDFTNVSEEFQAGSGSAPNVKVSITSATDEVKAGQTSGVFWARNDGPSRQGAWAHVDKTFAPSFNASRYGALGLWVYGDGKGELLNLQLNNPPDSEPCWDDHYIRVDFTGWKYFELLLRERDAEEWARYSWPDTPFGVYGVELQRNRVGGLRLFYTDLPPGEEVKCCLKPDQSVARQDSLPEQPHGNYRRQASRLSCFAVKRAIHRV